MTTLASSINRSPQRKKLLESIGMWLILAPLGIIVIIPLLYMASMAFTPEEQQYIWPIKWIPTQPTFANFITIWYDKTLPVAQWFVNSLLVATVGTLIVLFITSLSAYAYARLEFPGRNLLFAILLISLMIPGAVTLIPSFLLLRDLSILDTYHAIWWPGSAGVFGVFLLRQHFLTLPRELEDAAFIDGAGRFRTYWSVSLPLVRSSLVALGIFTFLFYWNDLFWPLIVLSERTQLTLPVGLLVLGQGNYQQRGLTFAAAFMGSAPPLVFYEIFQRQIIEGITTAGLAGR